MFNLEQLAPQINAYKNGMIPHSVFVNWFEDNSVGAYEVPELKQVCIAVDAALSEFHFDSLNEDHLKMELENAIRAFGSRPKSHRIG